MGEEAFDEVELTAEDALDGRRLVVRGGYGRADLMVGICEPGEDLPETLIRVNGAALKRALRGMVIGRAS